MFKKNPLLFPLRTVSTLALAAVLIVPSSSFAMLKEVAENDSIAIKSCTKIPTQTAQQEIEMIKREMLDRKAEPVRKRRELDLTGYPCFTSITQLGQKGECGFQFMDYGSFARDIFADVHAFQATADHPLTWVEAGAGFGAFPLRAFEYVSSPTHARFIVNDQDPNNLKKITELILKSKDNPQNRELYSCFKVIPGDCLTLHKQPLFKQHVPDGANFISAEQIAELLNVVACKRTNG